MEPTSPVALPTTAGGWLTHLGIPWQTTENVIALHALAERAHHVLSKLIFLYSAVELPLYAHLRPLRLQWEAMLLETIVAAAVFPDPLPVAASGDWDVLATIRDDHIRYRREQLTRGFVTITEDERWSVRGATMAAFNCELAKSPAVFRVGPVATDSAHRVLILAARTLLDDREAFIDAAERRPSTEQPKFWDEFTSRWCHKETADQLMLARATLTSERERLRYAIAQITCHCQPAPVEEEVPLDQEDVEMITKLIGAGVALTRQVLAERTGYDPKTIKARLPELMHRGLIAEKKNGRLYATLAAQSSIGVPSAA